MRGEIRNKAQATQIKDFTRVRFGNITPTDIDGFIDFGNKLFVFIEGKYRGGNPSTGQRIALERLVDACNGQGRHSVLFMVSHTDDDKGERGIDYSMTRVVRYRWKGSWHVPKQETHLMDAITYFKQKFC